MIVITGAAGFIGSNLAEGLWNEGFHDLVLVDDFSNPLKARNWNKIVCRERVHRDEFFVWLEKNHRGVQYIFHLGARTNTLETDEEVLNRLNYEYSKSVWEFCSQMGIPLCYASSAATYGDGKLGFNDDVEDLERLKPLNPYGWSKHRFDLWAVKQERTPPQWVGLKFFNVYGKNEQHKGKMASVVWHAYHQIKETGQLKLFKSYHLDCENGNQKRDFVFVKDLVKMMILIMNDRKINGIFNAGSGKARTFNELSTVIFDSMNLSRKVEYIEMPENLKNQYQYFTEANMFSFFKKKSLIFTPIEIGVSSYIKYLEKGTVSSIKLS